jgi:hypothetical protein
MEVAGLESMSYPDLRPPPVKVREANVGQQVGERATSPYSDTIIGLDARQIISHQVEGSLIGDSGLQALHDHVMADVLKGPIGVHDDHESLPGQMHLQHVDGVVTATSGGAAPGTAMPYRLPGWPQGPQQGVSHYLVPGVLSDERLALLAGVGPTGVAGPESALAQETL